MRFPFLSMDDTGQTRKFNFFNSAGDYWNLVTLRYVSVLTADCQVAAVETESGKYQATATHPTGGPCFYEVRDSDGNSLAADSTAVEYAAQLLTIPGYVGPVIVVPAPPSPGHQTIYGYAKESGAVVWRNGDTITMTTGKNQTSAAGIMLKPVTRTTVVADGTWSLTPDKGVEFKFTAGNETGVYWTKNIMIDDRDTADQATYP